MCVIQTVLTLAFIYPARIVAPQIGKKVNLVPTTIKVVNAASS